MSWGDKWDLLMYVMAGKAEGTFIFGMKGVPEMEGDDWKHLLNHKRNYFPVYGFLTLYPVGKISVSF